MPSRRHDDTLSFEDMRFALCQADGDVRVASAALAGGIRSENFLEVVHCGNNEDQN